MTATRLVLGSKSPARLATLRSAGVDPLVIVSDVDEDAVERALSDDATPAHIVSALAEAKALSVAEALASRLNGEDTGGGTISAGTDSAVGRQANPAVVDGRPAPDSVRPADRYLILGCDSMLHINGRMVGKPHTAEVARRRIQEMRGTDATLWTGHSLVPVEQTGHHAPSLRWTVAGPITEAASTVVHFGDISDDEIEAYIGTGEPLKVAGSFTIDGFGGPFVRGVTGDPHSVVGVSLPLLRDLVRQAGTFWPDLWEATATD